MKYIVNNYESLLDLIDTQKAIKLVKDTFEDYLASNLNLIRVSAPLFVEVNTGLNDDLTGSETPVSFDTIDNKHLQIVQSLAKWKRYALKKYDIAEGLGIYTDMNAIRPSEEADNMHSLYVDQWDWEIRINKDNRNVDYLKRIVQKIYEAFLETYHELIKVYPSLNKELPKDIYFIDTNTLEAMYPNLSSKERENRICKEHKAVFLMKIGGKLNNGEPHDFRAADYDDWELNGDILLWYDQLGIAFELSSMGIRVNKESLLKQLKNKNEEWKLKYMYHQMIMNDELPLSIGGGIGQSRICMFMLNKVHIGEVQSSYWSDDEIKRCKEQNINLL